VDHKSLISPSSVAVLGASNRIGSVGNAVMTNILSGGFIGRLFPVNPSSSTILGMECYSSILDIDHHVDLAIIITPSKVVPHVIEECGKKGVKTAIIISAGFKEIGEQGKVLEESIKRIAKNYGMRVVGPNCIGIINTDPKISLNASFTKGMPRSGNIALVSQSGAICVAMLEFAKMRNIGFSKVFSLGNKVDLDENDLLRMLANDASTKVILMYIEDLTSGRRFIEIASKITGETEKRKPILALKVGESATGAKAIASHTGALAGSKEAYNAIFAQSGVLRVETLEELFDYAIAFAYQRIPSTKGTVVVSNAGGLATIVADAAAKYNLYLARLNKATIDDLTKILPKTASLINPIDIIGDADHTRYEKALWIALKDRNVDSCIIISTPQMMLNMESLADVLISINKEFREKITIITCMMGISGIDNALKKLDQNKIPQYSFPESAARAIATMHSYRAWITRPRTKIRVFSNVEKEKVRRVFRDVKSKRRNYVHEIEAMHVLDAYGFLIPKFRLATTEDECVKFAEKVGYPVVLKISSPDVVHKVDVGGVELNLKNSQEVRNAFKRIIHNVELTQSDLKNGTGINIQEFVEGGKEVILGMKRDPQFGPLLMFGSGGIYVELFKDVSFRLAPIKELSARNMIESTKAYKLLSGIRGEKPSDIESIIECLQRLSQLVIDFPEIQEIDINPLLVFQKGNGYKAVDGRIVIS
jgi:acetyl coenzyme A synthetase (ADP forming)-like protein